MNTQEYLDNLNQTLIKDGVSKEERLERVATLKHCIEFGEEMSAKLKVTKKPTEERRQVELPVAIEWSIWTFVVGWMLGIITLHYAQRP